MRPHRIVAWSVTALFVVAFPAILAPGPSLGDAHGAALAAAFARLMVVLVFAPLALGTWIVSLAMGSDERKAARRLADG